MPAIQSLDPDQSIKHWIASDLRFYRERERASLSQYGGIMGCSRHTVSNIEHARDGWNMNEEQADRLDAHLQLNGHFGRLVRYARTIHDPDWFAEYSKFEATARTIRTYRLSLIPGLFQTPAYAHALISSSRMVENVDEAVQKRMKRQEVLARKDPPHVWALLDESVLHRPVGGDQVMHDQLGRLLELVGRPNVSVRVISQSAGYYIGLEGSFNNLTLGKEDLVFVEAPGGGRLIRDVREVRQFAVQWDWIGASALPWGASRDLIVEAMERL